MHSVLYILAHCKDRHMISNGWFLATTRNQFFSGWVGCCYKIDKSCVSLYRYDTVLLFLLQFSWRVHVVYMCVCLHVKLHGMSDFLRKFHSSSHHIWMISDYLAWSCGQGYSSQYSTIYGSYNDSYNQFIGFRMYYFAGNWRGHLTFFTMMGWHTKVKWFEWPLVSSNVNWLHPVDKAIVLSIMV